MNPIFYVGCFVGMCIVYAFPFIAKIVSNITAVRRSKLSDAEARFERAARDRDEWKQRHKEEERRHNAALDLAQKLRLEMKRECDQRIAAENELKNLKHNYLFQPKILVNGEPAISEPS